MKLRLKSGGAVLATGLLAGSLVGAFGGASGAGAAEILFPIPVVLSTTSFLTASPVTAGPGGVASVTLTDTVSMELVKGLLISPSGSVDFDGAEYQAGRGENYYGPVYGTLSKCLLGLPGIGGLWSETCSATVTIPLVNSTCGPTVLTSVYSGLTDLLAGPSRSNNITLLASPIGCQQLT